MALSVVVHAAVIVGSVAATQTTTPLVAARDTVIAIALPPVAPLPRHATTIDSHLQREWPGAPLPPIHPIGPPIHVEPVPGPAFSDSPPSMPVLFDTASSLGTQSGSSAHSLPDDRPHDLTSVDRVEALVHTETPAYPEILRQAGVEGRVVVRFVVDTLGRVEPASIDVRESTHPLFTRAVELAVPRLRFSAAEANGRRVRMLVEMPFEFSLDRR